MMHHKARHRGFTLVEAMIAMAIVAVLLTASMQAAGTAGLMRAKSTDAAVGATLADALMADILRTSYADPNTTPVFGRETGESSTNKATFDDVDDFHNWTESPPREADNASMTDMNGWSRSVQVAWVLAATPTTTSATETGVKRITVTVKKGSLTAATRVALRTAAP